VGKNKDISALAVKKVKEASDLKTKKFIESEASDILGNGCFMHLGLPVTYKPEVKELIGDTGIIWCLEMCFIMACDLVREKKKASNRVEITFSHESSGSDEGEMSIATITETSNNYTSVCKRKLSDFDFSGKIIVEEIKESSKESVYIRKSGCTKHYLRLSLSEPKENIKEGL